jgi:hypothetical protein
LTSPLWPLKILSMNEDLLERMLEKKIDNLDSYFLRSDIDDEEYTVRMNEIWSWYEGQLSKIS